MSLQTNLNAANPTSIADGLRRISFGDLVAGMIPRVISRTSLSSSATHVEPEAGAILQVIDTAGTTAQTIVTGSAGAGEVTVSYDANGVATLVFGSGAVTAYQVVKMVLPEGLSTLLAADSGSTP